MSLQENLYNLFLLEKQVRGMRSRLDNALRREAALSTRLRQYQVQAGEITTQLKQAQAHAATLESDVREIDERVSRARTQMNSVKSNKEYSALLVEVSTLKQEKSTREDAALQAMSDVETLQQKLSEADAKVADQQKLVEGARREVEASRAEVGQQLDEVTAKRDAAATQVPPDIQAIFRRLSDEHEGEALAPVVEEDRRRMEYTCGGCFLMLPAERVNTLIARPDEMVTCPACRRILYMEAALKDSMVANK